MRKNGDYIKDIAQLEGKLQVVCRPGNKPQEEYVDVYLERQDVML